jgi:hypothetical protein
LERVPLAILPSQMPIDCSKGRSKTYQTVVERHVGVVVIALQVYKLDADVQAGSCGDRTRLKTF